MENIKKYFKNHKTLVFLDLEGTQFSHEIIAIGAVKVSIDEDGKIIFSIKPKTFLCYVKCLGTIGKIVQNITSITEDTLREKGLTLEESFKELKSFVKVPLNECTFVVFGSNDTKMILDSISYSHPHNEAIGFEIVKNSFDYLNYISQYIKDDKGNNYSLVNYLKVFKIEPHGVSHNPLNDAYDLMNLYKAMDDNKEVLLQEYLKVLQKQKLFPSPIKKIIQSLTQGNDVTSESFIEECRNYLK